MALLIRFEMNEFQNFVYASATNLTILSVSMCVIVIFFNKAIRQAVNWVIKYAYKQNLFEAF